MPGIGSSGYLSLPRLCRTSSEIAPSISAFARLTAFSSRPAAWREQVRYVAIDMSTVFLSAVRQARPHAVVVVDHFHVVQLANQAVTDVRRRVTWTLRGRRGRASDGEWQVRHLLIRARENLSQRRFARMWNTLVDLGDPGYDILAAYIAFDPPRVW